MESIMESAHPRLVWLGSVLPPPWGGELRALLSEPGIGGAEELRLRIGSPLALRVGDSVRRGHMPLSALCLGDLLTRFCEGALYAHRDSLCRGYVTLRDGCRVGVCGRATVEGGVVRSVSDVSSLCLRLPGPIPPSAMTMAETLLPLLEGGRSILICAPPGAGKTTLLRALARQLARRGRQTAVVDTRCELTPHLARTGGTLDLLSGYPRRDGIEIALRTLGAEVILCDEIGRRDEADAILDAGASGVSLVATVHGRDPDRLPERPALAPLFAAKVFSAVVVLDRRPGEKGTLRVCEG